MKITSFVCQDTGIDGNKRLKGRKRYLAVDVLGYPLALLVQQAGRRSNAATDGLIFGVD